MLDPVLDRMLEDFVKVLHDLEWYESADYSEDTYRRTVEWFKTKWIGKPAPILRGRGGAGNAEHAEAAADRGGLDGRGRRGMRNEEDLIPGQVSLFDLPGLAETPPLWDCMETCVHAGGPWDDHFP